MTTTYIDYSGYAGNGDGSTFADRTSLVRFLTSATYGAGNHEIRLKGNPITSVGTAKITGGDRNYDQYGLREYNSTNIHYSTTTGQTYISAAEGYVTGDRILVYKHSTAVADNQPSLCGLHTVTADTVNDRIYIDNYTANSNATGSSGDFDYVAYNTDVIELNTSNVTREIASMDHGRSPWTPVSGVTASLSEFSSVWDTQSNNLLFSPSDLISVPSSQAVGKIAHYQLPSTLDLSGYQQISFMVRSDAGNFTTPDSIRLCTDTAGNTSVHTAPIQLRKTSNDYWIASVTDLGANMNSSIQSIAIYRDNAQASSCEYRLQNIIACKASSAADSITHKSVIGVNDTIPIWYNIGWIRGNFVSVKAGDNYKSGKHNYYDGVFGVNWTISGNTTPLYKVEPFDLEGVTSDNTNYDSLSGLGTTTSATNILISGGWNDTDMSSKSGATIISGNGRGVLMYNSGQDNIEFKDLFWHNCTNLTFRNCSNIKFTDCGFASQHNSNTFTWSNLVNCRGFRWNYTNSFRSQIDLDDFSQHNSAVKTDFNVNSALRGYFHFDCDLTTSSPKTLLFDNYNIYNSGEPRLEFYRYYDGVDINSVLLQNRVRTNTLSPYASPINIGTVTCQSTFNIYSAPTTLINTFTHTRDQTNSLLGPGIPVNAIYNSASNTLINNAALQGSVKSAGTSGFNPLKIANLVRTGTGDIYDTTSENMLMLRDFDGTSGDYRNYTATHTYTQDSSIVHTASGKSLKAQVTNTSLLPIDVDLGSIMVNANSPVTISCWVYITAAGEKVTMYIPKTPYMGLTTKQEVFAGATNTGTTITETDGNLTALPLAGTNGFYASQTAMTNDGWTFITSSTNADDTALPFNPGSNWTGLDFLDAGVSSANWFLNSNGGVGFDAQGTTITTRTGNALNDAANLDFYVSFWSQDSESRLSGYKEHTVGGVTYLVVRTDQKVPYSNETNGYPVEVWFGDDESISVRYGTVIGSSTLSPLSSTSHVIVSNGNKISGTTAPYPNLTSAGNYGYLATATAAGGGSAVNTWTQISKVFTPTSAGKLDVKVAFSNGFTGSNMYVDDFVVSQV